MRCPVGLVLLYVMLVVSGAPAGGQDLLSSDEQPVVHFGFASQRETEAGPDDVAGEAFGHCIVICGYRSSDQTMAIADPLLDNPAHGTKYYRVNAYRLLGALFLDVGSDDGNLLLIRPKGHESPPVTMKS